MQSHVSLLFSYSVGQYFATDWTNKSGNENSAFVPAMSAMVE